MVKIHYFRMWCHMFTLTREWFFYFVIKLDMFWLFCWFIKVLFIRVGFWFPCYYWNLVFFFTGRLMAPCILLYKWPSVISNHTFLGCTLRRVMVGTQILWYNILTRIVLERIERYVRFGRNPKKMFYNLSSRC